MKKTMVDYIQKTFTLCVLATSTTDGKPEAALLHFVMHDDGTLLLMTEAYSKKVQYIKQNPQVALVFGTDMQERYIQMEGTAKIYDKGAEYARLMEHFFTVRPGLKKNKTDTSVMIHIRPEWIRILDFQESPVKVEEEVFAR